MTLEIWLAIISFFWGVLASILAFFSITSDRFSAFLLRQGIKKLPQAFVKLADEYRLADKIPDTSMDPLSRPRWDERVRKKDIVAAGLGYYALGRGISRRLLAKVADDGYIVALAHLIATEPRQGDIQLISDVSRHKVPAHVDYRLLAAIEQVAEAQLIQPSDRKTLGLTFQRIEGRLGPGHKDAIARVRWAVENATFR